MQFITPAGPRQSLLLAKGPDQHLWKSFIPHEVSTCPNPPPQIPWGLQRKGKYSHNNPIIHMLCVQTVNNRSACGYISMDTVRRQGWLVSVFSSSRSPCPEGGSYPSIAIPTGAKHRVQSPLEGWPWTSSTDRPAMESRPYEFLLHCDSGCFLVAHTLLMMDGCQWEGFWEVVGHVAFPFDLS